MNKSSTDPHDALFERELNHFLKDQPLSATPAFSARVMENARREKEYASQRSFFRASTLAGMAASIAILFSVALFFMPGPEEDRAGTALSDYNEWEEYADIIILQEFLGAAEILLYEENLNTLELLALNN